MAEEPKLDIMALAKQEVARLNDQLMKDFEYRIADHVRLLRQHQDAIDSYKQKIKETEEKMQGVRTEMLKLTPKKVDESILTPF